MNWTRIIFASECHPFLEEAETEPLSGRDLTMAADLRVLKCIREFFISLAWVQVFGCLLGLGSYDNPNEILIHKHTSFTTSFWGISFISATSTAPTTYVGSWALVVSTIDLQFLLQFLRIPSRGLGSSLGIDSPGIGQASYHWCFFQIWLVPHGHLWQGGWYH
jgi:hypothetical protein